VLSENLSSFHGGGASGSILNDCTLSGNHASSRGAGAYNSTLNNCVLTNNSASYSGGGATDSTLTDCVLMDNYGHTFGGGTDYGTLTRCTLSGGSSEKGGGAYRGTLTDCVLSNNIASYYGGGIYEGTLNNCIVVDNSASYRGGGTYKTTVTGSLLKGNSSTHGAGADGGGLSDCVLIDNVATGDGGGMRYGTLNHSLLINNSADKGGGALGTTLKNCTVSANSSNTEGGGTHGGSLINCIVYGNVAPIGTNCYLPSSISYSCTTPDPGGIGNITANPLFVVKTANNYHLQSGSPCIDSGSNTNMDTRDLDGVLLPLDGNESGTAMVDMGCYEYLNPTNDYDLDTIPNGWEADHNLNPAVDDRSENMDNASFDNFEDYIADTDPTDPNDGFQILEVSNNVVFFNSSDARRYTLLGCTNLVSKDWNPVQDSKMGTGGSDSISSTNNLPVEFYKLEVGLP
jgi:hypothetical protein